MRSVPTDLAKSYSKLLINRGIPPKNHYHFQKWLRYYMDFCHKYQFIPLDKDSLTYFVRKLHEKNQTMYQQKQTSDAIEFYYEMGHSKAETTLEYYSQVDREHEKKGARVVQKLLERVDE